MLKVYIHIAEHGKMEKNMDLDFSYPRKEQHIVESFQREILMERDFLSGVMDKVILETGRQESWKD